MSPALQSLASHADSSTLEEIMVMVLYLLVVETGYVPFPSDSMPGDDTCRYNSRRMKTLSPSPKSWLDSTGFYQTNFILAPYPEERCKLVCVPFGTNLIANMYCTNSNKIFACVINPSEYVALYPNQVVFKRLKNLSLNFKSQVVVPIRTVMLNEVNQTTVGLFALPVEVLLKIVSFLKVNDFLKWSSTCKYFFNMFSYDERIWKRFCLLKFYQPSVDVKESHREFYRRKMNFRNRVSCRVSHFQDSVPLPEI